jgi:hypothetical protein
MHTEDEAFEKWCPFSRAKDGNRVPFGADGTETKDERAQYASEMAALHPCIGSACMAWQWSTRPFDAVAPTDVPYGYCRIAGRPAP